MLDKIFGAIAAIVSILFLIKYVYTDSLEHLVLSMYSAMFLLHSECRDRGAEKNGS